MSLQFSTTASEERNSSSARQSLVIAGIKLRDFEDDEPNPQPIHKFRAYIVLIVAILSLVVYIYAAFVTKMLGPDSQLPFASILKNDFYYCYLIPLTLLPTYFVLYLNWLSMQYFESN